MTNFTVTNGLVRHGEFSQVVTDHVRLNFHIVPVLAGVDFAYGTNHLWHDDAVTKMSFDSLGLLTVNAVLNRCLELLDKSIILLVDTSLESSFLS